MMLNRCLYLPALTTALCISVANAEVYKWVDKNGVTNYSAEPPKDAKAARKVDVVEDRISVYPPDAAVIATSGAASSSKADRAVADKIDSLQRQLDAERLARQNAAAAEQKAAQAAHDRCVAERRVDCDAGSQQNWQQAAPVIVTGRGRRPAAFAPTVPLNGVTAGNVTNAIANTGAVVNRTPGAAGR
jgi:hypothetical protein